jgi:tRNA (guanine10-N2)-dimethyltransferase
VDLRRPATDVRLVFSDKVHVGRLLASIDRTSFERRKNRYMPFVYPASIHPKFARAAVNLTEVRREQKLLDPFSGTGAILVEAAMVGCETIGSDISERMIEGAAKNLGHLKLKAALHQCDVGEVPARVGAVDGIASDLPYGRSTSTGGEGISDLYARTFDSFDGVLGSGSRAVVVMPSLDAVASEKRFEVVETHKLWVHRSLTRHFCVLRKL